MADFKDEAELKSFVIQGFVTIISSIESLSNTLVRIADA